MKILITGITGQDGRLLADYLLGTGCRVIGTCRPRTQNFPDIGVDVRYVDITDTDAMATLIRTEKFDEIYNLAAQSHVGVSFGCPAHTFQVNALGAMNVFQAAGDTPVYQASTSELFGHSTDLDGRSSETTGMLPHSPYGIAKLAAHHTVKVNRLTNKWPHYSGILFNHESSLRGPEFVTRKIAEYTKDHETTEPLRLGNLDAERDWGHAEEYVRAMVMILRAKRGDYVVATGKPYSVRQFVEACFECVGNSIEWDGDNGYDLLGHLRIVGNCPEFLRPLDIDFLCGNPTLIQNDLHWKAHKGIKEIAADMMETPYALAAVS